MQPTIELRTKDGATFTIQFKSEFSEASGLLFRGRHFFFRMFKDMKLIFEEGTVVRVDEQEILRVTLTL